METATKNPAKTNDGELLASFLDDRRPEAFAEIVRRHGPLVLGVCRSVLGNSHDAEDAAQAVFLALFHKAASLRRHPSLAGWLHQVAWYVAAHEKRAITTRTRHEQEATAMKWRQSQTKIDNVPTDLLHEGLSRLPEKYRLPLIMHHLEGHSQEEVADLLGEKSGTIMSRLNHGRQMLRDRLAKTGAAVSMAALATAMAGQASAGVSSAFVASVTKMAVFTMTAKAAAAGAASAKVLALSKGALNMLFMAKVKVAAMLTAAVCLAGGTAAGTYMAAAGPGRGAARPQAPTAAPAVPPKTEVIPPPNPSTPPASSGQVTTIEITDKALVKDAIRLGANTGDDGVWSGCIAVKNRVHDNFEGTIYRQCHWGIGDENGVASWFGSTPEWNKLLMEGTYTVLSGGSKQTTGKLKSIGEKTIQNQGKDQKLVYFELDKPIAKSVRCGLLVENLEKIREGQFRPQDERAAAKNAEIVILDEKDKVPGSFGCAALNMKADGGPAFVLYMTFVQRFADNNGTWNVEFWAKAKEGSPKFTVKFCVGQSINSPLASQSVELTNEWKKHKATLKVAGYPEPTGKNDKEQSFLGVCGSIILQSEGGQVLVDDVEAWQEGDKNPTVFRDEYVEAIKLFSPGSLRFVQMGGDSMENTLMPPMKAYSCTFLRSEAPGPYSMRRKKPYGMHEFLALCEYVGADPWYCVPGTLHLDEAKTLMEYLGGPADSKYGKIRADLGHAKPWTETFKRIHVEFGNEAWNNAPGFQVGGFNGPDYWKDLIETGKKSPYYKPNILFHAASQASNYMLTQTICNDAPNADRMAIAPYMVGTFSKEAEQTLDSDDKLFRWAFGYSLQRALDENSSLNKTYQTTKKAGASGGGIELSVYEFNYHTTSGGGSLEARNRMITSQAGGVNVANTMLLMLKKQGIRIQNVYSLAQYGYRLQSGRTPSGRESTPEGLVRLWGTALNMRKGLERYRPSFLACSLANKVMGGDLVETVQSGAKPTFQGIGKSELGERPGNDKATLDDFKGECIWSYAFSDGKKRGLILVNLDLNAALPVELKFQGKPKGKAKCWTLAADKPAASNEFENDKPQVSIKEFEEQIESGGKLTLPPCSMQAYQWELE